MRVAVLGGTKTLFLRYRLTPSCCCR